MNPLTETDVESYHNDGYLVLPGVLEPAHHAAMLDECMRAWEQEKSPFDPAATWLHNSLVHDIHRKSSLVGRYYRGGPLVDVAERLIGPNVKGASTQLTFKMRGNTMPFGWHQDNGYGELDPANALSTLTALDNADEGNGCLWLIPGSHKQGQIDVSDRLTPETKAAGLEVSVEVANPGDAIPVRLKAGDAVVFHCHTLHRSEGNHSPSRDRRIIFIRYADADAVEVYNERRPRLGPLLRGVTTFPEVGAFERDSS